MAKQKESFPRTAALADSQRCESKAPDEPSDEHSQFRSLMERLDNALQAQAEMLFELKLAVDASLAHHHKTAVDAESQLTKRDQKYAEQLSQLRLTVEAMLSLMEEKTATPELLIPTKRLLDYVGISERTLQRAKREGLIKAVDERGKEKYYRQNDVVALYYHYHKRSPSKLP